MTAGRVKLIIISLFAVSVLVLASVGLIIMNDAVTEMRKSNERPVETDWTTFPGWPEWPAWPEKYPVEYTMDWPDDQSVSVTHYKPPWADAMAAKLTAQGGKFFLSGTEYIVDISFNPTVTAEEYMFKVEQYTDPHTLETMYIPYEQIVRIKFNEAV